MVSEKLRDLGMVESREKLQEEHELEDWVMMEEFAKKREANMQRLEDKLNKHITRSEMKWKEIMDALREINWSMKIRNESNDQRFKSIEESITEVKKEVTESVTKMEVPNEQQDQSKLSLGKENASTPSIFSSDPRLASTTVTTSPLELASKSEFLGTLKVMLPVVGSSHDIILVPKPEKDKLEGIKLAETEMRKKRSANVFGEIWKSKPLFWQRKSTWKPKMDWLLCESDSIVELIPSVQEFPGGGTFEIMMTQQQSDLYVNLPTLKKLDAVLISSMDEFCDTEFYFIERERCVAGRAHIEANPCSQFTLIGLFNETRRQPTVPLRK